MKWLWRRRSFTLIVHEPFGGKSTVKKFPADGQSLFAHLRNGDWKQHARARIDGKDLGGVPWEFVEPKPGQTVELIPGTGVKSFTEGFITRLNRETEGGTFLKAAIVTVSNSPLTYRYLVDYEREITFNSNTYEPLSMSWQDFEISTQMNLPTMRITVPNIGGEIGDYVEKVNILENDVVLQLLHLDLLGDVNAKDELKLQIQMIEGDDLVAQFTLGYNLGFQDNLPRKVVLREEFPGLVETYSRFRV